MNHFEYRRQQQPGCGCGFLLFFLFLLLLGRPDLLMGLLGALFYGGLLLALLVTAGFWGFSYFVRRMVRGYEKSQTETHNTFVFLLVNILVKIAQIDGSVTRAEVNTIRRFFQENLRYSQSQLLWVKELIKEALRSTASLEQLLSQFRAQFAYEPRIILLELIYQVIFTKGQVPDPELQMVRNIAHYLGISVFDWQAIEAKYRRGGFRAAAAPAGLSEEERCYEILGLKPGASFEEIKASYRRLSMKYHPDKVGHLGEEFRKVAEEKMKELNVAYEFLKKKFQGNGGS